jgi:hypothetical protein
MSLDFENEQLEFKKTIAELNEACVSIGAILNKHKKDSCKTVLFVFLCVSIAFDFYSYIL